MCPQIESVDFFEKIGKMAGIFVIENDGPLLRCTSMYN